MSTMAAIAPRASCSALAGTGSGFDQQGTLEFGQRGDAGRLVWKSFGASHYLASQIFAASRRQWTPSPPVKVIFAGLRTETNPRSLART